MRVSPAARRSNESTAPPPCTSRRTWSHCFGPTLPSSERSSQVGDGRVHPGDLLTTALRESHEEVGIRPEHVSILGRLDDLSTFSTSFTISPFVGLIPSPYPFRPNPIEVAVVFDAPLSVLADPTVGRTYIRARDDGATIEDYEFHVNGHVIWGATARIIRHFLTVINRIY